MHIRRTFILTAAALRALGLLNVHAGLDGLKERVDLSADLLIE